MNYANFRLVEMTFICITYWWLTKSFDWTKNKYSKDLQICILKLSLFFTLGKWSDWECGNCKSEDGKCQRKCTRTQLSGKCVGETTKYESCAKDEEGCRKLINQSINLGCISPIPPRKSVRLKVSYIFLYKNMEVEWNPWTFLMFLEILGGKMVFYASFNLFFKTVLNLQPVLNLFQSFETSYVVIVVFFYGSLYRMFVLGG